jgi:hypothetical protein
MPVEFQGFGTSFCSAAGDVYWGAEADRDAVECFVVFNIPLFPLRAVHIFDDKVELGIASIVTGLFGRSMKHVPIEYRRDLFLRALFRRISPPLWITGSILAIFGILGENASEAWKIGLGVTGGFLLIALAISTWILWWSDRRNKAIRYVLGRHEGGTSDPATWPQEQLGSVAIPNELFGTRTFSSAVTALMEAGRFSEAMWAARLCAALESRQEGEQLTGKILDNLDVREAVRQLKSQEGGNSFRLTPPVSVDRLKLWRKLMTGKTSTPGNKPQ